MFPVDIEVSDLPSIFKAISSRCDFKDGSGIEIPNGVYSHLLDPSSKIAGVSSKMRLGASKPIENLFREATVPSTLTPASSRYP